MWIAPHNPNLFYLGNDGGVAVSRDRGRTAAFVGTLPLAQFYHVAVDLETPYNIYGGLQDNGSWRGPNTTWWGNGIRNHEWLRSTAPTASRPCRTRFDSNYVYSLSQGGELGRYDLRTGELRAAKPAPPATGKNRFNWNTGLATDSFDAGTLYIGSQFSTSPPTAAKAGPPSARTSPPTTPSGRSRPKAAA